MLKTEMRNEKTKHIDKMSVHEMVSVMCEENYHAVKAVEQASKQIEKVVEVIAESFQKGGRLFFIGAGTSGRLGVLDAAECPPTFGVDYDMVNGIIAGGDDCMRRAAEGAEDKAEKGAEDIKANGVKSGDVVVGISVAGGAAYVEGALKMARSLGAVTVSLSSNYGTKIEAVSDYAIVTDTGAEVITGSTRLKAGTAHKMVLNILTTCSMVKMGYVYENMMINLRPSNIKLTDRMVRIVTEICDCDYEKAKELLEQNDWSIRKAVEFDKGNR
ncbi:MAG: N-acetylmuramic acid 6-phosphate etherase [Ruminococcaceae bacterium]|nr:N-acetylmuramic acid 6-phosphate etherase [Oscillospiraceae bacterium]